MKINYTNLLLVCLFFTCSCSSKKERIENKVMDCIYKSYEDKGSAFEQAIIDYETLLIEQGFLKDKSGKSYRDVFVKISENNEFKNLPSTSFGALTLNIEAPNADKVTVCQNLINDTLGYNVSKIKSLQQAVNDAIGSGNVKPSLIADNIFSVLTNEDFELDYYKLRVFYVLGIVDKDKSLLRALPKLNDLKENKRDLSNAIHFLINGKNEILVNNEKVNLKQLRKIIRDYYLKHKNESVVTMKHERETGYKEYIEVQNEVISAINELRDKLAIKEFNSNYQSLIKEQKDDIKKVYPLTIIEGEIE